MGFWEKNRGNKNGISTGGVGYVIMPNDSIGIADYIQQCYRSGEITITGDGYGTMSHVKVIDGLMTDINFPNDIDGKGSLVVWIRESFYNRPIVIGILTNSDTAILTNPGQCNKILEYNGISVGTFSDALNGILNLIAVGKKNRSVKLILKAIGSDDDDIELNASNKIGNVCKTYSVEATAKFEINIDNGEKSLISISGDEDGLRFADYRGNEFVVNNYDSSEDSENKGETEVAKYIQMKDMFGREYIFDKDKAEITDQFGNKAIFNEENIQFLTQKFNCGNGAEPMVLGNTLKGVLEELIQAITAITVPTPNGVSGTPLNTAQFSSIKSKLSTILSQLSNTD